MHVLIIEDEFLIALALEEMLRELGYTSFDWAATEQQAIEIVRLRRPDLITADLHLHNGSGLDAVLSILSETDIATIFVTANDNEVAQFDGAIVLSKPVRLEELREACAKAASGDYVLSIPETIAHAHAHARSSVA